MTIYCFKKNKSLPPYLLPIKNNLKEILKDKNSFIIKESILTSSEKNLLQEIKEQTISLNKNNVTRTQAYLNFYKKHPEVEWSLLGHMVSRNGGWNMTDLKGEFLSKLLSEREQQDFFDFLERGNWLIFQDIYPQFLIYEVSLKENKPLFHLLPYLYVSRFMEVLWEYFWSNRNRSLLTLALIINEQAYLEQRVIQNSVYKKTVLNTIDFKLQDLLRFNHILFPSQKKIIGQTVSQFDSLDERIMLGRRLYSLLFDDKNILNHIYKWAINNPHTGSRQDYWPEIFHNVKETLPGQIYEPQLKNCKIPVDGYRIYSPQLVHVWPNTKHIVTDKEDWFKDVTILKYLNTEKLVVNGDVKDEYCETLEKLEWTIYFKKSIFHYKN